VKVNITELLKTAQKVVTDNSPAILTAVGVAGVVTTAILTGKASYKASRILGEASPHLPTKDKVELVWKLYIAPVTMGALTITAIVAGHTISDRRAAAVAAAFSLSETAIQEYKDKVKTKIGEAKEQKLREEIAQDRVNRNPPRSNQVIVTGTGKVLCYETYAGRYFYSSKVKIERIQNEINHRRINDNYVSLSDFYYLLGLEHTSISDNVGWNLDKEFNIEYDTVLAEYEDQQIPCLTLTFSVFPITGYSRMS
jgi:hypothetical protein